MAIDINREEALISVDKELAKKGLRQFVQIAWRQVEPSREFLSGWHIDAICEHLEAVTKNQITRLVINVPPGSMKSLLMTFGWNLRWIVMRKHRSLVTTMMSTTVLKCRQHILTVNSKNKSPSLPYPR